MSRMKEIQQWHEQNEAHLVAISNKMDSLLHLMSDMVKLEAKLEKTEEEITERLKKMEAAQVDSGKLVDRLIEMTLVQKDQPHAAAIHRTQSRLENNFSDPQSWSEEEVKEEVWPPPGCDAMDIRG